MIVKPNQPDRNECAGKAGYRTKGYVRTIAARAEKKTGKALRFYRCDRCRLWHLTSRVAPGVPIPDLKS